jgi:anaerobic magnesium-protoporphyrin IX monomethyl ester cyclase
MGLPRSCKVVLVQPNDAVVYSGYQRSLTKRIPLGLAYLAGSLLAVGHQVAIVDASLDDMTQDDIVDAVLNAAPHVAGFTCTTPLFPQVADVVNALKQEKPDLLCVLGGPHVSSLPEASLARCRADIVCIGDGEATLVQLLQAIHEGRDLSVVPSLCHRSEGR